MVAVDEYPQVDRWHGKRGYSRLRLCMAARLISSSATQRAALLDLSCSGARVSARRLPPVGADVVLAWEHFEAFGTIVRSGKGECGIRFETELPLDIVIATRNAEPPPSDTAMARAAAADWVSGQARFGTDD